MKHAHKLVKVPAKKTNTWRCIECSFFVHEGLEHVLVGKEIECWGCGDVFRMTEQAMTEDKPRCDNCRTGTTPEEIARILKEKGLL